MTAEDRKDRLSGVEVVFILVLFKNTTGGLRKGKLVIYTMFWSLEEIKIL